MRSLIRLLCALPVLLLAAACTPEPIRHVPPAQMTLDEIAQGYVKLVLAYGELEPGYIDAYYGPPEWQTAAKQQKKTLLAQRNVLAKLQGDLTKAPYSGPAAPELVELRRTYLRNQLGALAARIRIKEGWKPSFNDEAVALYDIQPPRYDESDFDPTLEKLDQLLPPGAGTLADRYNAYMDRYAIPASRLEVVMQDAIAQARAATSQVLRLPQGERFELAFVKDKPWSAYNWYQGNMLSRIEINTDLPITVSRAIHLAVHVGYPGHHVYNSVLEDQLVKGQGWVEYSVYPLYSPQSFIAEGTADFGVGLAFPPGARLLLMERLFKLAGLPVTEVQHYDAVVQAARGLNPVSIEAARRYRDGRMDRQQTIAWLQSYGLYSQTRAQQRLDFIDTYGPYVINYSFGEEVVRAYVERQSGTTEPDERQWGVFWQLISTPRTPTATFDY